MFTRKKTWTEKTEELEGRVEVLSEFFKHYPFQREAQSAVCSMLHVPFFESAGVPVPDAGVMLSFVTNHFQAPKNDLELGDRGRRVEDQFEIYLCSENNIATQIMIERDSRDIYVRPADPLEQLIAESRRPIPGLVHMVGACMTLIDTTTVPPRVRGGEDLYNEVKPSVVSYRAARACLSDYVEVLAQTEEEEGISSEASTRGMIHRILSLPTRELLLMQSDVASQVLEGFRESGGKGGGSRFGRMVESQQADLIREQSNNSIEYNFMSVCRYQERPIPSVTRCPVSLDRALTAMRMSQAFRGGQRSGFSTFTHGHRTGGTLSRERVRITDILSLAMPLLDQGPLEFVLDDPEDIRIVQEVLETQGLANQWRFVLPTIEAVKVFGMVRSTLVTIPQRTPGVMLLDMVKHKLPSVPDEKLVEAWEKRYDSLLPRAPFVAYRKVPPSRMQEVNVYKIGSSHAFDFIISSHPIVQQGVEVSLQQGAASIEKKTVRYELKQVMNEQQLIREQWVDERRRVEMYFAVQQHVTFLPSINLWQRAPGLSCVDRTREVMEIIQGHSSVPAKRAKFQLEPVIREAGDIG